MSAAPAVARSVLDFATLHVRRPRAEFRRCMVRAPDHTAFGSIIGHTELAGTVTAYEIEFDDRTSALIWPAHVIPAGRALAPPLLVAIPGGKGAAECA